MTTTTPTTLAVPGHTVEVLWTPDRATVHARVLATMAAAQAAGGVVAYVGAPGCRLDLGAVWDAGLNAGRILVSQPADLAQAVDVTLALVRSGEVAVVILAGARLPAKARRTLSHLLHGAACALVLTDVPPPGKAPLVSE